VGVLGTGPTLMPGYNGWDLLFVGRESTLAKHSWAACRCVGSERCAGKPNTGATRPHVLSLLGTVSACACGCSH
jgi:hypothetical protein